MTPINDRIGFRGFLARVFISNSGVSSRRVLAFMFSIQLVVLLALKFPIEYCWLLVSLIGGLLALTTISSYGQKTDDKTNTDNNGK